MLNGILVVDKPEGLTSRDVVNKVSNILGTKKIGHTGTLDPLATGVLVLTVGKYTKLGNALTSTYKEYEAELILGFETDTLDTTGIEKRKSDVKPSKEEIINAVMSFKGKYMQEVPLYSAVKVNGRRLYDYARRGEKVEPPKREVEISNIEVLSISDKIVTIRCTVSKGTYIRSLIRDIGVKLGTYATMSSLVRTKQGDFSIENAYSIDDVENGEFKLLDLEDILKDMLVLDVDAETLKKVSNGTPLTLDYEHKYILFRNNDINVALYVRDEDKYRMFIKL